MCNFMIAHLQDGQFGSARILKPETAKLMPFEAVCVRPTSERHGPGFYERLATAIASSATAAIRFISTVTCT